MRFKSPGDEPIQVSLTSGHTAIIGTEFDELPAIFHRQAIALGAVPEGAEIHEQDETGGFDRKQVIADAMRSMLDGNKAGDFTPDGKPDSGRLSAVVGFAVPRDERDAIWTKIADELLKDKPPATAPAVAAQQPKATSKKP